MRLDQRLEHAHGHTRHIGLVEASAVAEELVQCRTSDVLHHQVRQRLVGHAEVDEPDRVSILQHRQQARFVAEAFEGRFVRLVRMQHLDRDPHRLDLRVVRQIDLRKATGAKLPDHAVTPGHHVAFGEEVLGQRLERNRCARLCFDRAHAGTLP